MRQQRAGAAGVDAAVARFAAGQYGTVSFRELLALGVSPSGITRRLRACRLYRLHRAVYSTIPPNLLPPEGRWLAAVKACGGRAVLSHRPAAALWELVRPPAGRVDVTIPGTAGRRRRPGLRVHRCVSLTAAAATVRNGIPVTTPRRTLRDLRRVLPPAQFAAILRRAEMMHLDAGPQPEYVPDPDRTPLERRMLALCRRYGLPTPRRQVVIGPYTVDFLWPHRRLVVEVDGWEAHGTRSAFEADRARDAELKVMGYDVLRFTWRQIQTDPDGVAATLRALLGRA